MDRPTDRPRLEGLEGTGRADGLAKDNLVVVEWGVDREGRVVKAAEAGARRAGRKGGGRRGAGEAAGAMQNVVRVVKDKTGATST